MNLKQYIDGSCEELKMPEDDSYKIKQIASEFGDEVKQIEVPDIMKIIPKPCPEVVYEGMWHHPVLACAWKRKMEFINEQKLTPMRRRMKIQIVKNKLIDMYALSYMTNRDELIYQNNQAIKALGLYTHDKSVLTRADLIDIYETQKGFRRFPTQAAYDYYLKTGKRPFVVHNN